MTDRYEITLRQEGTSCSVTAKAAGRDPLKPIRARLIYKLKKSLRKKGIPFRQSALRQHIKQVLAVLILSSLAWAAPAEGQVADGDFSMACHVANSSYATMQSVVSRFRLEEAVARAVGDPLRPTPTAVNIALIMLPRLEKNLNICWKNGWRPDREFSGTGARL